MKKAAQLKQLSGFLPSTDTPKGGPRRSGTGLTPTEYHGSARLSSPQAGKSGAHTFRVDPG